MCIHMKPGLRVPCTFQPSYVLCNDVMAVSTNFHCSAGHVEQFDCGLFVTY